MLLNLLAYFHAWSMLHYAPSGARTEAPERLGQLGRVKVLLFGVNVPRPVNDRAPSAVGLAWATVFFPTSDGLTLEGWWIPRSTPRGVVLLFHGFGGWKATQLEEARTFHDLGYACLLVDLRGSGGSSSSTTSVGYREADDVAAAVRFTRRKLDAHSPIVLYGQSMGGVAILRALAVDSLDVRAAIVESVFDRMIDAIRNRFAVLGVPSFPAAELLCFWGGVQLGIPAFDHDPVRYAERITMPVLMMNGVDDPRATLAQARRVFDRLRVPRQFVEFKGAGHENLRRVAPEEWRTAVAEFLGPTGLAGLPETTHSSSP